MEQVELDVSMYMHNDHREMWICPEGPKFLAPDLFENSKKIVQIIALVP